MPAALMNSPKISDGFMRARPKELKTPRAAEVTALAEDKTRGEQKASAGQNTGSGFDFSNYRWYVTGEEQAGG